MNIKYKSFSFFNQMKFVKPIIDDNFLFSKEKNDIKKWNLN